MDQQGAAVPPPRPTPPPGVPTFTYGPVMATDPLVPPPGGPPPAPRPAPARRPRGLLLLGLVAVLAVVGAVLVLDDDGGRARSGATALQVRDQVGPAEEPDQAWRVELDCGESGSTTVDGLEVDRYAPEGCTLAADEDRAYVVTRDGGSLHLAAHARGDGEQAWRVDLPGEEAYPIVVPGLVLADGYDDDGDDVVVAVAAATGEEAWRTPGAATGYGDDRTTVVTRFGDATGVAAVSLRDGTDRWEAGGELLAVCPDVVLVATGANVVAHDLTSGDERWRDPKGGAATAACAGGEAYVLEGDELTARSTGDGAQRWRAEVPEGARLDLLEGAVVATTADEAVARERGSGRERWTLDLADRRSDSLFDWTTVGPGTSLAAWADHLDLVDERTGERVASEAAGRRSEPARGQGLVVRLDGAQVVALDLDDLARAWAVAVADDAEDLALGGGALYVVDDGALTAYR